MSPVNDQPDIADREVPDLDVEAQLAASGERKGLGAYYTPDWLVNLLLDLTLQPILDEREHDGVDAVAELRVLDPTCGSGNFLVEVARRIVESLVRVGLERGTAGSIALGCVVGVDLEPRALDVCRRRLMESVTARGAAAAPGSAEPQLLHGDVFTMSSDLLETIDGVDLVIGNPPFLSQLRSDTTFSQSHADRLRQLYPGLFRGYTDSAALALIIARRLVVDGGRFCLIQPTSTLASDGVAAIRAELLATSTLTDAWIADEAVFDDAAVEVWAPVFTAAVESGGVKSNGVTLRTGRDATTLATIDVSDGPTWSGLLAAAHGVPQRTWATCGTVADIATATADFRDQYYGLVGHVIDQVEGSSHDNPKLVTSGLIDPAELRWGRAETRFNKTTYRHPRVVLATIDEPLRRWADDRLVPKVLVATQTRVLEAIVDAEGDLLPSVPVITLTATDAEGDLWRLAALLVSPPIAAIAASRHMGSAMSNNALKLSASDVVALPLPTNTGAWTVGADAFRAASRTEDGDERRRLVVDSGHAMCLAFGQSDDDELLRWWIARLPRSRPLRQP